MKLDTKEFRPIFIWEILNYNPYKISLYREDIMDINDNNFFINTERLNKLSDDDILDLYARLNISRLVYQLGKERILKITNEECAK